MAGLTAWVVADLDMTLEEFHSNVIIVSIIQEDAIVLCSGHLLRRHETLGCKKADFALVWQAIYLKWDNLTEDWVKFLSIYNLDC